MRAVLLATLLVASLSIVASAPAQAAGPALFTENEAEADCSETLTFSVVIESDSGIQTVELYWRPEASDVLSLEIPDFEPSERVSVQHVVDMTIDYLPPGLDITWFWRVTDA